MTAHSLAEAVRHYARACAMPLPPQWQAGLRDTDLPEDSSGLAVLAARLDWHAPVSIGGRPRPDQFPLLVHDPATGWATVGQWDSAETMARTGVRGSIVFDEAQRFFSLTIPDPLAASEGGALAVFWRAIIRRKQALVMAALATVFANLLTLATSLYSMQLFDRVIPLASFDTLFVLTAGVVFALLLDFCLRSLRSLLIEREAQDIDVEVSDFFFARAQAIRLDSRPSGIGTMAAQLRSQDQVRQVLSSGSLFLIADLPFALFFILVIAGIGGQLALVPIISLPIALILAWLLSSIIRKATDRAQISGNRKNGMLVESLDAAETVKANRGDWFMLGRWSRLVREIQHHELPVKQASAIASTLFSTLQQTAYVVLMGWGAYLAATGAITTGALLACSILAGRINGPLVAQLPNLIVQWGYARSSINALDEIMRLPTERATGSGALRPDRIEGGYAADNIVFAYPRAQNPAIDVGKLSLIPGERVAVIGGIGSGKSTLLKLLAGLYSPQQGSLLLGGVDLGMIAEDVARHHIGYVPQDARLLNGTLRDNLSMGIGDVDDAAILDAARATGLDGLIAARQEGLGLPIQEGGRGLSGGQRSLVGITRLLIARPRIWLLDEPTAALDQQTERTALDAIFGRLEDVSLLVMVTHKLPLLTRFTRVIAMANGRIVRDGPTAEMLRDLMPKQPVEKRVPDGLVTSSLRSGKAQS